MSLQVWLPLNGNVNNQGLLSNPTISTTPTYVDGKLGKALSTGALTLTAEQTKSVLNNKAVSFCFWIKVIGTDRQMIFGNDSMSANNNRKFAIFQYPTVNDLHLSWMNDTGNNTFIATILTGCFPNNIWTHCAITYENPICKVYINGEVKAEYNGASNSSTFAYSTPLIHNSSGRLLNDFRIYDHCLSAKEVKEISKGLVLHYQLKGFGQPNLLKGNYYNYKTNSTTNTSGSLTLDTDIMPLSSMVGKTFTFSFDYSVEGDRANSGSGMDNRYGMHLCLNYTPSGGSAIQDYPCASYLYMTNTGRAIQTFTVPANCTVNSFTVAIQPTTKPASTNNATWYIRNAKLELGNKATPWCPNSADSLYSSLGFNSTIEPDCSGFRNNGIKTGSIIVNSDSARYNTSYQFIESSSGYIKNTNFNTVCNSLTIAYWIKVNPTISSQHFLMGTFNNWTANGIGIWRDTGSVDYSYLIRVGEASNYSSWVKPSLTANVWTHIALVYNGTALITYKNGIEIGRNTYGANGTVSNPVIYLGNSMFNSTPNSETDSAKVSDFRFYATALSVDDIKELYNSSISIDKSSNLFAYEFMEV